MKKEYFKKEVLNYIKNFDYKKYIKYIGVFGSYSRNENRKDSDLDLIIKFTKNHNLSIFDHLNIQNDLKKVFKIKVDLVSYDGLSKYIKQNVKKDLITIYER